MKSWMLAGIVLCCFSLFLGCDDSSADSLVVSQSQNGGTVALAKGETLAVELAGNPTTGYEWTIAQLDAAFLRLVDSSYSADSSAIGSGGAYTFRFEALQAGATTLGLVYRRPWETTAADPSFTLAVNIQGSADAAAPALENTQWKLAAWSANSIDPARFDVTADFTGGQISGRSAVNSYGGAYSASADGTFSVGALALTEMAGEPDAMQAESLYLGLLAQARRWHIEHNQLILSVNAADLLVFGPR